jgi:hypothetical protein
MEAGYREVQKLSRGPLVLVAVAVLGAIGGALALGSLPGGSSPPAWFPLLVLAAVLGLSGLLMVLLRLVVEARPDALYVRFIPLRTRRIPYASILRCEPCTYRPIRDFGGWGIRWGGPRNWAYTIRGNRGVRLHLEGGQRLLVGSQTPDDLARAIEERRTTLP